LFDAVVHFFDFFSKDFRLSDVMGTMQIGLFLSLSLIMMGTVAAESRKWRSKDGSKFIIADYLSHNQFTVTVKRVDGKVVTLDRGDLHTDDMNFLAKLPAKAVVTPASKYSPQSMPAMDDSAVFDTLKLGDSRADVIAKIKASKSLELTVDEIYLGRFGLNGSYRTKQTIGGLKCLLYFDWDSGGNLKELSLQTQPQPASSYQGLLKDTWQELSKLMTTLHGKPLQNADYPAVGVLQNDTSLSTHLWRLGGGGSALLGTSKSVEGFMVSVRFTTESIEPIRTEK
jgi:hypothetical protein